MKVLLVAEWIKIPGFEGGAVHHTGFVKALSSLGHEVHILCNCEEGFLEGDKNIFLHSAPKIAFRPKLSKASASIVEKLIKKYSIDVVHKRLDPGSGYSIRVAHDLGVPVVAEINYNPFAFEKTGSFSNDFLKPLIQLPFRKKWAKKFYEEADAVECVSHSIQERIIANKIHPKLLGTIPNGVDVEEFNPENKVSSSFFNFDLSKPVVSLIGSLGPRHGLREVIEVAKHLPEVNFLVVGGAKRNQFFVSEMKKIAPKNVIFLGKVPHDKIKDIISLSTICLAPYRESINPNEPFGFSPIKILEYLASGKPVIASNLNWIRELIENKKEGVLVNSRDVNELKEAIELVLKNNKLRKLISNRGRAKAKSLSWENVAKKYINVYKKVML